MREQRHVTRIQLDVLRVHVPRQKPLQREGPKSNLHGRDHDDIELQTEWPFRIAVLAKSDYNACRDRSLSQDATASHRARKLTGALFTGQHIWKFRPAERRFERGISSEETVRYTLDSYETPHPPSPQYPPGFLARYCW